MKMIRVEKADEIGARGKLELMSEHFINFLNFTVVLFISFFGVLLLTPPFPV